MGKFKLIALDLDGTLLDDQKHIPDINLQAVATAQSEGYQVVLCTGRPLNGVIPYADQVFGQAPAYLIINNGTNIIKWPQKDLLVDNYLKIQEKESIWSLVAPFLDQGLELAAISYDGLYLVGKETPSAMMEAEARITFSDLSFLPVDHFISQDDLNKCILLGESAVLDQVQAQAEQINFSAVNLIRSQASILEFCLPGINKAQGLAKLCRTLGIQLEEVMAVGDQLNDYEMLAEVGLSVAMGQSHPQILALADKVVASNEAGGVAQAIYELLDK